MERVGKCVVGMGLLIALGCGQRRADEETRSQPARDAVQETLQTAKEKAHELKERLPEETREARQHVRDALQDAKEKAQELKEQLPPAEEVKEDLREAGQKAAEKLKAAGSTIEREALQAREKIRERVRRDEH